MLMWEMALSCVWVLYEQLSTSPMEDTLALFKPPGLARLLFLQSRDSLHPLPKTSISVWRSEKDPDCYWQGTGPELCLMGFRAPPLAPSMDQVMHPHGAFPALALLELRAGLPAHLLSSRHIYRIHYAEQHKIPRNAKLIYFAFFACVWCI